MRENNAESVKNRFYNTVAGDRGVRNDFGGDEQSESDDCSSFDNRSRPRVGRISLIVFQLARLES